MPPAPILLVSPDAALENRLASWMESRPDYVLAGAARSLGEACSQTRQHEVNTLLVDLAVTDSESEESWATLKSCYPNAHLIAVLEADTSDSALRLAAAAGARAFLLKDAETLWRNLEAALQGTPYVPDVHFFERLWPTGEEARPKAEGQELAELKPEHLTPRERLILQLIAEGLTNQQIAKRLRLREKTVKNRVSEILSKIGVQNRTQLAIWALKHGLGGKQ